MVTVGFEELAEQIIRVELDGRQGLSWMDSFPAVHEAEAGYVTRDRKRKRRSKKVNRQRR